MNKLKGDDFKNLDSLREYVINEWESRSNKKINETVIV